MAPANSRGGAMVPSAFASLVDSFLKEEYEDSPTLASSLGPTEYDERLDDTSAAAYERRRASDLEWLRRFRAVTADGLAAAESIDRDLLVSVLRGRELYQPLEMWKRQPNYYLNPGLNGVFSLFLHRLRPERELAAAAAKRLEGVPTNIKDGIANLDFARTPRVYAERAIGQARAAARYARDRSCATRSSSRCRRARSARSSHRRRSSARCSRSPRTSGHRRSETPSTVTSSCPIRPMAPHRKRCRSASRATAAPASRRRPCTRHIRDTTGIW